MNNAYMRWFFFTVILAIFTASHAQAEEPQIWIDQLSNESYAKRDQATEQLRQWGKATLDESLPLIYQGYAKEESPEAKRRLFGLLKELVIFQRFPRERGYVGITMNDIRKGQMDVPYNCVLVRSLMPDGPAFRGGLQLDDKIFELNGQKFHDQVAPTGQFGQRVADMFEGDEVTLKVLRGDKEIKLTLELGRWPEELKRQSRIKFEDVQHLKEAYFKNWLKEQQAKQANLQP
ncbi:PDZ domain-containing protein [Persicirhabdus sediminis]|uniref:PDZ domain-containing protein n=1 Tax=Persicirhabdus sediminis TaxID=454144 RepID=A0A8J7SIG1_9BACT|nr:PDZ domain-containing protein [Persicirhabdus sediminis]MBK1790421.1 PDZ domain-containing protein [Persicirhabdus sediminis]